MNIETKYFPHGGFPPIYKCKKEKETEIKEKSKREYEHHKGTLSLKFIMESKKIGKDQIMK